MTDRALAAALARLPQGVLAGGLRDGAHVALWQEQNGRRRHLLDRATDRALCGGAWDGIDGPLARALREDLPPGVLLGWRGGWIHLAFDGAWRDGLDAPPPPAAALAALGALSLLPPDRDGATRRIAIPETAHARLEDGGRRDALAADPATREALWGTLPPSEPLLLRRRGQAIAWAVQDRALGHVLCGAGAA